MSALAPRAIPQGAASSSAVAAQGPQPLIPTTFMDEGEQRLTVVALFGGLQACKLVNAVVPQDIAKWLSMVVPTVPSTISSLLYPFQTSAVSRWIMIDSAFIVGLHLLRIPRLSFPKAAVVLLVLMAALSDWLLLGGWQATSVTKYVPSNLRFGMDRLQTLGGSGKRAQDIINAEKHLLGQHTIRLLPYSTANLNPLSLHYCIPYDDPSFENLFVPVLFNNSNPHLVQYTVRPLDPRDGPPVTLAIKGSDMRSPPGHLFRHRRTKKDEFDLDEGDDETDLQASQQMIMVEDDSSPLHALLRGDSVSQVQRASLSSIRPEDSLVVIPKKLDGPQSILFLPINKPGIVTLNRVVDGEGLDFQIARGKEAVVIECPSGGQFTQESAKHGKQSQALEKLKSPPSMEVRCVGDRDVAEFEVRGVGALKVSWKKTSKSRSHQTEQGVIEGIEETVGDVDGGAINPTDPSLQVAALDKLHRPGRSVLSRTHVVAFPVQHNTPGIFTVSLQSVTDSMHNTHQPTDPASSKTYQVFPKSGAMFGQACMMGKPLQLLANRTINLPISAIPANDQNALSSVFPIDILLSFEPVAGHGNGWTKTLTVTSPDTVYQASEEGNYRILQVAGKACPGAVMEPSSCSVQVVPLPKVDFEVTTLHECAGDVGITAAFDFTGKPPFEIGYMVQKDGEKAKAVRKVSQTHHDEIVLKPQREGKYTYTFTSLSDGNYKKLALDKPPIEQVVHPVATADIVGRGDDVKKHTMWSCSGDVLSVDVEASGTGPFKIQYQKLWHDQAENVTVAIPEGVTRLEVPLPDALKGEDSVGGQFKVSLMSIEDGNGCRRRLTSPSVEVDVKRTKPSVKFYDQLDRFHLLIAEGDKASLPLRLAGKGPWSVTYTVDDQRQSAKTIKLYNPNAEIAVSQKGTYRLTEIRDAHCAGVVDEAHNSFEVNFKPRPSVGFEFKDGSAKNKEVFVREPICTGQEDQINVVFEGQRPFGLDYSHSVTTGSHRSASRKKTLRSAQNAGVLHLEPTAGLHRYELESVSDAVYSQSSVSRASPWVLEQRVYSRPSVSFRESSKATHCLHDKLVPSDSFRQSIEFAGQAPFEVVLNIREASSSVPVAHTVENIKTAEWEVNLPQHLLESTGPHVISIVSMKDSSGCPHIVKENDKLSVTVDVVETARIVPVDRREDLCVGDSLEFIMQGTAPWTVTYNWNGREQKTVANTARFSRLAEKPGAFEVISVAHQKNQCKAQVTGLTRRIHPLPTARVSAGNTYIENIHEGDQAEIVFTFTGTPPFSFTYTRSVKRGKADVVLETQTLTGIPETTHSIFSSLEGDYRVVYVADSFCQYPPAAAGTVVRAT